VKRRLGAFAVILGAALTAAGCVGVRNATSTPEARVASVHLAQLPSNSPPIRIALLSDIHVGNIGMRPERLASIVRSVNAARPDIVLLAGDFVIGESKKGTAERSYDLALLADLRATHGVFAVMGNHDHWTDLDAIQSRLTDAGVQVLENEATTIGPITLVGLGDRFSGHDDIALAAARSKTLGGIPVAFSHSPDLASDLPQNFRLLLAGHTHCGQMVAPVIGPIVRYSKWRRLYDPKYRCGRIDEAGRSIFVTAGVGSGAVPLRFNAMPDWWLVELRGVPKRPAKTS
jgi:predicted MPP superfamily phosphohydrolase